MIRSPQTFQKAIVIARHWCYKILCNFCFGGRTNLKFCTRIQKDMFHWIIKLKLYKYSHWPHNGQYFQACKTYASKTRYRIPRSYSPCLSSNFKFKLLVWSIIRHVEREKVLNQSPTRINSSCVFMTSTTWNFFAVFFSLCQYHAFQLVGCLFLSHEIVKRIQDSHHQKISNYITC